MTFRLAVSILALAFALSACGKGGSPEAANHAADDFLTALVQGDVNDAWSHLYPDTRQRVYHDDKAAFARDVNGADWSQLTWQFGPVVDFDYAWEVHVRVDEASVPQFLDETGIAPSWSGNGLVMQVQTPQSQPYLIIGEVR